MKKFLLYFFLIFVMNANAQQHDINWPMGHFIGNINPYYSLDFSAGAPVLNIQNRTMSFFTTSAAISDTLGNLLFYTNGSWVANRTHDTLYNSEGFNPGFLTTYYTTGMGISQSVIILPFNDGSDNYYIISESAEFWANPPPGDAQPLHLTFNVVDMSLDNGNGGIVDSLKNINIINDTLLLGRVTACKHTNGRDWWVVVHKYKSDIYYKLLFTPNGVFGPYTQQIGPVFPAKVSGGVDFDIVGMAVFSPDGSMYAQVGPIDIMDVMNFDRCTGEFSNYRSVTIQDSSLAIGCSFSSNSRYLYANTFVKAFQYDTYASNIQASGIVVAQYDSFFDPFQTWFRMNQLAPDGKIYISTWCGCFSLHVIENPDSSGVACNFSQHSFFIPSGYTENITVPNFPNYRLGPLAGSPCDTLSLSIAEFSEKDIGIKISPNPNSGNFIINYSLPQNKSGTLEIFDVLGKRVYAQALPPWSVMQRVDAGALPQGMYVCVVRSEGVSKGVKWVKE